MTLGERIKMLRVQQNMSQEELGEKIGVKKSAVHKYESGLVVNLKQSVIAVLAQALNTTPTYLLGLDDEPNISSRRIPVLGVVPAGIPIEAIEDVVDWEEIPESMATGGRQYFGLLVRGDSMSPNYQDGDTLIVRKQATCDNGQDCVVIVNGDNATFKRVQLFPDGSLMLRPLNPNYDLRTFTAKEVEEVPVMILGTAVEIRRKIR